MRVIAVVLGGISAFFLYYTLRLLIVTHLLRQTRVGGQGAYVGAVVFPIIAIVFGLGCVLSWRRANRGRGGADREAR